MTPELATSLVFIAIILIPSLIALGGVVYISTQLVPAFKRQSQQLIDNNTELTKITRQNSEGLGGLKSELVKQTAAIELGFQNQAEQTREQGIDFKAYQSLVADGLDNYRNQMEANASETKANTTAIRALQSLLEQMPQQIILGIKDELACAKILAEFQALRTEIARANFQQQTRKTGSFPVAMPSTSTPTPMSPTLPPETPTPTTP